MPPDPAPLHLGQSRDALNAEERAELAALRDLRQRVIGFGGDDFTIMSWEAAHRHHSDHPYIGCVFCREKFVALDQVAHVLNETSRDFAGAHVNAGVVVGAVRRRLEALDV